MIIGVTGRSGSGKTEFCKKLAIQLHAIHVDVDNVCHVSISREFREVEKLTGLSHSRMTQKEFRRSVGELIFSDREKYKEVIKLIWDEACVDIDKSLFSNDLVILDHILLPYTHYWKQCQRTIRITCNDNERYQRILERDNISLEYLFKRESASPNYNDIVFDSIINTTTKD